MTAYEVIRKKRNGNELTDEEIGHMVDGVVSGEIPDYQVTAWLMAIYFQGMTPLETAALTDAMIRSGDVVDLTAIPGIKVDKHSTGGVGDKTSLVLTPMVAACGVPVAKMSGRGLGHTGGTLDKLESIPGLTVALSREQFLAQVSDVGLAIAGQTGNLVPADKTLYGLRDVTATVDSIPLIAASIMSKKLAAGADAFVLDVKTGSGAFMNKREDARNLAEQMVDIAVHHGKKAVAVITNMDQPLGRAVGNALELREAIATLHCDGPADLTELCLTLGSEMLVLAEKAADTEEARKQLEGVLKSGQAWQVFSDMVAAQGGDVEIIKQPERLPASPVQKELTAKRPGYVQAIDAMEVGLTAMALGAGRRRKGDEIDLSVGLEMKKKVGSPVAVDDVLAVVHATSEEAAAVALNRLQEAVLLSADPVSHPSLILERVSTT